MLLLLLYFCLFVDHVNKPIIFNFGTFVYYFNNTISIFVTNEAEVGTILFADVCMLLRSQLTID